MNFKCVVSFYLLLFVLSIVNGDLEVKIPLGRIQGHYETTENGNTFIAFRGIPYGEAPIGELRFKEPIPVKPWNDIYIANSSNQCTQYSHMAPGGPMVLGEEDCLKLDVFVPTIDSANDRNVIIFIHGGAFTYGSSSDFGPGYLLDHNVIYVSINYRLGPLGFLSTENCIVPGNNGLKDQALALKWVKNNIEHFGGNPKSITLSGMSAGSASVLYHMLSTYSYDLFDRVFAVSGSPLNPWSQTEASREKAKKLAASVNCTTDNLNSMVQCLRTIPDTVLAGQVKIFQPFLFNPYTPFGPVVERCGSKPFINKPPIKLLKSGRMANVPCLLTMTNREGLYPTADFLSNTTYLPYIDENWYQLAPSILDYNYTVDLNKKHFVSETIKRAYTEDRPILNQTFDSFTQMVGDRLFRYTIEMTLMIMGQTKRAPTYLGHFIYQAQYTGLTNLSKKKAQLGAAHADDLRYIFPLDPIETESDKAMQVSMMQLWLNFAQNSIPKFNNQQFVKVSRKSLLSVINNCFEYNEIAGPNNFSVHCVDTLSRRNFWLSLPFHENE